MLRAIVAIDEKRGIATDKGIPWLGKIPGDTTYYRSQVKGSTVIIGHRLYEELSKPYEDSRNLVALHDKTITLRPGFEPLYDVREFMTQEKGDIWNLGGAMLYDSTFDLVEEIYITQLEGEFGCTKFFPDYEDDFELIKESSPITENGITYTFQIWKRKS